MHTTKRITIALLVCLSLALGVNYSFAWTGPTQTPPNGNTDAPINVSGTTQYKSGAFGIGGVFTAPAIKITNGASNGYVLTSDANGLASWQAASGGGSSAQWKLSGSDAYWDTGKVCIGSCSAPFPSYFPSLYVFNPNGGAPAIQATVPSSSGQPAIDAFSQAGRGIQGNGIIGVYGWGSQQGVKGELDSDSGQGVVGVNDHGAHGVGVAGYGTWFDFFAGGAGTNYGSPSSIRWKRNITPISDPLDKISKINGVFFDWDKEHGSRHDVGMIAEEVGKVLPEIVVMDPDAPEYAEGMDYSRLTPLLVEAVKAQQKQIDELKAEISSCVKK